MLPGNDAFAAAIVEAARKLVHAATLVAVVRAVGDAVAHETVGNALAVATREAAVAVALAAGVESA